MVDVGLHLIGGNANLTFVFFIAFVLLTVLGSRFAYYAYRNLVASDIPRQATLWRVLVAVGVMAALYALLGVVDIVSSIRTPYRGALLVGHAFSLSLALAVLGNEADPGSEAITRLVHLAGAVGALVVAILFAGSLLAPTHFVVVGLEGLAGLAVGALGFLAGTRGIAASRVQGTVVDSLLRHLLPVLLFATFVPALELVVLAGLDRVIVLHIQVVFVIMTATALMTGTIKLRQNLAGL